MKFAQTLSKEVQQELHKIYQQHACFRNRQRAHAILLSQRGYTLNQIQDILQADRDSISVWIDRFNADGVAGLDDLPRSGRPLIYTSEEIAFFKAELDKEPRQIKQAQAKLQQQTAKTASKDTLKRVLKNFNYSWHRCRRSTKAKRDPDAFTKNQKNLSAIKALEDAQKINLFYFDESGFSTASSVPYAWQPKGQTLEIPCFHSKRLNILGFMSRKNAIYFHALEGSVKTSDVIAAFDAFTARYALEYAVHKKHCIIILDNASIHTSAAFLAEKDAWASCGVVLHYLPTYSPELNLIEILWRFVKYHWLPLSSYLSYENLKNSVLNLLSSLGSEYRITFT